MKICIFDEYFIKGKGGSYKKCEKNYICDSCEISAEIKNVVQAIASKKVISRCLTGCCPNKVLDDG